LRRLTDQMHYHFSRAIYRELSPYIVEDRPSAQRETNNELVLRSCEQAMQRLLSDPRHFAKPARSLFNEIRIHFSMATQLRVYLVVKHNVELALAFVAKLPEQALDDSGAPRQCQAMTRKGKPCQRTPLPRSEYCPSHQHLIETFDELEELPELEEVELAA
jgi:hypothetical protein